MPRPAGYTPHTPRGIAFDIVEHVAIRAWAEARGLHVATEIDRVIAGEEYEEVLALYEAGGSWRRMVIWRAIGAVVIEPTTGPARRFGNVWDAIEVASEMIQVPFGPMRLRPAASRAALSPSVAQSSAPQSSVPWSAMSRLNAFRPRGATQTRPGPQA